MIIHRNKWLGFVLIVMGCSQTNSESERTDSLGEQTQSNDSNDVTDLKWQVPEFTATEHTGRSFTSKELEGKVWLVDLVFTRCNNVCPPMTANMSKVQQELKKKNLDVHIVSFSVDPAYDQPHILASFAKKHHAELTNWSFLTGYSLEEIQKLTQTAFKGTITQRKGPSSEVPMMVDHPTRFYLIDRNGQVRKLYNGLQPDPKQIAKDIQQLK